MQEQVPIGEKKASRYAEMPRVQGVPHWLALAFRTIGADHYGLL
jgi:hypothetical protein